MEQDESMQQGATNLILKRMLIPVLVEAKGG